MAASFVLHREPNVRLWPLADTPLDDCRGSYRGEKRTCRFGSAVAANDPKLSMAVFGFGSTLLEQLVPARTKSPSSAQSCRSTEDRSLGLILSDINMPGMSGLELLPKAKAMRPEVPIIMMTAYGDADTKRKALEDGAEALLTKPLDFATLRSEIDNRVERAA